LEERRDYELCQAWMAVFLKMHVDSVSSDVQLVEELRRWRDRQDREGRRVAELVGYCGGVVSFLRSPRT